MSAFPLVKLGMLAVRQISKPLANAVKDKAKTTPFLRSVLARPAQLYHRLETTVKMRLLGMEVSKVKPLSDELAVELAADMLGELVVFGVAAGCLLFEYKRQQRKEAGKEDVQNARLKNLEALLTTLALDVEEQNARLRELNRAVAAAGGTPGVGGNKDKKPLSGDVPETIVDEKSKTVLKVVAR